MTIANQAGASFRSDLNNLAAALVSQSGGATAPSTTYAYQWWADSANDMLKQRNAANSAWISVAKLSTWAMPANQVQAATAAPTTGSAGAYVITPSPAVTNAAPTRLRAAFNHATTGACTLAASGQTALPLKQYDSTGALVDPIIASGMLSDVESDGTNWIVRDPLPNSSFATLAEVKAGSSAVKTVSPSTLNGALGFSSYFQSANQTITTAGALTLAHGLAREPILVQMWLKCLSTGDGNFAVGKKILVSPQQERIDTASIGTSLDVDATNINIRFSSSTTCFTVTDPTTGANINLTNSKWALIIGAWA